MAINKSKILALTGFYFQGLIQGIAFTTIPAAAGFLTSQSGFALDTLQYGSLYLPMILGAILACFTAGVVGKKVGIRVPLLVGLTLNSVAMAGFALCSLLMHSPAQAFMALLAVMLAIGLGFGALLTALNSYALFFFPKGSKTAITFLHTCLGVGTALGPLLFDVFYTRDCFWGDPLLISFLFFVLLISALIFFPNPMQFGQERKTQGKVRNRPLFLLFLAIAFFYGVSETAFGNWGTLFLTRSKGFNLIDANFALALFWAAVTAGRLAAAFLSLKLSFKAIYRILSPILLCSVLLLLFASKSQQLYVAFAMAGLGCSAFLPFTVGLAQERFAAIAPVISGLVMGIYMAGYGVVSQGVGVLSELFHLSLSALFAFLIFVCVLLFYLILKVTKER